jgi:hypothetical protein
MANTINGLKKFYDEQVNLIVDDSALKLETYFQDGPINQVIEQLSQFTNPESSQQKNFNILITKASGPSPRVFKYIIQGRFSGEVIEYTGNQGTITGRSNSSHAITVGAASYDQTPAFGAMSPILQFFSSAGGDTLFGSTRKAIA